jgi:hypothetical protein
MARYVLGEGVKMFYRIAMPSEVVRFQSRGRIPLLDFMRGYLNERVGKEVYRFDLITECVANGYNEKTVDTYRSYLTSSGYLIIVDRGKYHVLKEIPYNHSLADIKWEIEYKKKKFAMKRMYVKPAKTFITKDEMML